MALFVLKRGEPPCLDRQPGRRSAVENATILLRRHEEEEESEEEEEEKEEEKRIEDIVRTKFEGDAHRALFHVIGKKRNFVTTGRAKAMKTNDDERFRIRVETTTKKTNE